MALLVGIVVFPGAARHFQSRVCRVRVCTADGMVRWSQRLTGTWLAENGVEGTVLGQGQAYASVSGSVAVIGFGLTVDAFDAATGKPEWTNTLNGPAGSSITSVRAWPGAIAVGVAVPPSSSVAGFIPAGPSTLEAGSKWAAPREEVVLNAATGKAIRAYPAAAFGGAVSASTGSTVIIGTTSVTSYNNATGAVLWRHPIGPAQQAWRVDGGVLYVTVSAHGVIGVTPVTAVRQINLSTGTEQLIRPPGMPFDGVLSGAAEGVLYFSGTDGLSIYSALTGRLIASRPGSTLEGIDPMQHVLYADVAGSLVGIDPTTGKNKPRASVPGPFDTYGVRAGVGLGLDPGAAGAAWGYSIARRRVIWTSRSLAWPHYFVDPSGLGGSADQASDLVLLTTCGKLGQQMTAGSQGGTAFECLQPMLVAIDR